MMIRTVMMMKTLLLVLQLVVDIQTEINEIFSDRQKKRIDKKEIANYKHENTSKNVTPVLRETFLFWCRWGLKLLYTREEYIMPISYKCFSISSTSYFICTHRHGQCGGGGGSARIIALAMCTLYRHYRQIHQDI